MKRRKTVEVVKRERPRWNLTIDHTFPVLSDSYGQQKPKPKKMTFFSLEIAYNVMEIIDFPILYHEKTEVKELILNLREDLRIIFDTEEGKYLEKALEEYEPPIEFKIDVIIKNLMRLYEEKECRLATINNKPYYYNNYNWEEIMESFMKDLILSISERNGLKDYEITKTEMADLLYKEFKIYSAIQTSEIVSNDEMTHPPYRRN
jgi:hypothetical protein